MDGRELERQCFDIIARCCKAQQVVCAISGHFQPGMLGPDRLKDLQDDMGELGLVELDLQIAAQTAHGLMMQIGSLRKG